MHLRAFLYFRYDEILLYIESYNKITLSFFIQKFNYGYAMYNLKNSAVMINRILSIH